MNRPKNYLSWDNYCGLKLLNWFNANDMLFLIFEDHSAMKISAHRSPSDGRTMFHYEPLDTENLRKYLTLYKNILSEDLNKISDTVAIVGEEA